MKAYKAIVKSKGNRPLERVTTQLRTLRAENGDAGRAFGKHRLASSDAVP
jgi:hypothetical protein